MHKIKPSKLPSKIAKKIFKENDGLKRTLNKISGINEELLGSYKITPLKDM